MRARLLALGLLPADPCDASPSPQLSGYTEPFNTEMERAVRHFQQERSLTADGVVGPETFRHLEEARWKLGDRLLAHTVSHLTVGDDVAQLQQRLLDMGFAPGRVD